MAEDGSELDAEEGQGGVGAVKVDSLPVLIRFVSGEDRGVEAVLAGVAVAGLCAAFSLFDAYGCHNLYIRTFVLVCQGNGGGGSLLLVDLRSYPPDPLSNRVFRVQAIVHLFERGSNIEECMSTNSLSLLTLK